MAPAPLLTIDEYLKTPETLQPTELIYGALRAADAPSVQHQQAVGAFYLALALHVRQRGLGKVLLSPVDLVLDWSRALVLQPDLAFVSDARWQVHRGKLVGPPDLVLEVLSPNPRIGQLDQRIDWFLQYGVREVWLLHQTTERLEILSPATGGALSRRTFDYLTPVRSEVLPDFAPTVGAILRE